MTWITTIATTAESFLSTYASYVRWAVLALSCSVCVWATHHWDKGNEAIAVQNQQKQVAASVPEIITKTQTVLRVIHDSKDTCVNSPIDPALLSQLRQQ